MIDKPPPELPTKLSDEMTELQYKINKGIRLISDMDKEIDNRLLQLKLPPKQDDQRLEFGHQNAMTGDNFWPGDTRYVPRTQSQDTVPCDTGQIARNVPRTQDTVPSEVARNLHRTQGCQESARQKIPNITPPGRDMLNVELSKQPWFFGDIPFQIAWENMQEKAVIGNYLVLQNEEFKYYIVWMSCHRTIKHQKITAGALLKFIKAGDFDTDYWDCSVQSFVQECENNVAVCVKPLPNKEQL